MRTGMRVWMGVAAAWGAVWAGGAALAQGGPPPASVILDAARMEKTEQYRPVTGELVSVRRAVLAAEEEGLVIELLVEEGASVEKGAVVARLRDTRARLDVARAEADVAMKEAEVAELRAELTRATQDLERVQTLSDQSSAAWKELADRKSAVAVGEARVRAAEADVLAGRALLEWSREQLARMVIEAPFGGRIISKKTEVGQWVQKGDGVVELLSMDEVDARLDVPERFLGRVAAMTGPVRVRLQATGEVFEAPVTAIIPDVDPRSRLAPVRVRIANKSGVLRPGMSITGLVPSGSSEATLTVHKDAILRDDAGEYVFFNAGGMAAVARIRTLFPVGGRMAIEAGGLPPDAQVVIEGNERLFPGQPLMPAGGGPARGAPTGGGAASGGSEGTTAGTSGQGR